MNGAKLQTSHSWRSHATDGTLNQKTSLSVQIENYAISLYKKVGFEIIDENNED